jgi:hypothetical protein
MAPRLPPGQRTTTVSLFARDQVNRDRKSDPMTIVNPGDTLRTAVRQAFRCGIPKADLIMLGNGKILT